MTDELGKVIEYCKGKREYLSRLHARGGKKRSRANCLYFLRKY